MRGRNEAAHYWHNYAAFDIMHARRSHRLMLFADTPEEREKHETDMNRSLLLAADDGRIASEYESRWGSVLPGFEDT